MTNMMNIKNKFGLSANILKVIAITAMLIDHIAYRFLAVDMTITYFMRMCGRLTAPIMCYFIAEGFFYTKNIKKYTLRMGIAAIISHFAYVYFTTGDFLEGIIRNGTGEGFHTSVIYTLFLGLVSLIIWNNTSINHTVKIILIIIACFFAEYGDWGCILIVWILIFHIFREDFSKKILGFSLTGLYVWLIPVVSASSSFYRFFMTCNLGIYFVIPLLWLYNGKLGKSRGLKWAFYIFYPLHMLVIGMIYYFR